jgi:hypothetical protein
MKLWGLFGLTCNLVTVLVANEVQQICENVDKHVTAFLLIRLQTMVNRRCKLVHTVDGLLTPSAVPDTDQIDLKSFLNFIGSSILTY